MAATARRSSEASFKWSGRGGVVKKFLDHITPSARTNEGSSLRQTSSSPFSFLERSAARVFLSFSNGGQDGIHRTVTAIAIRAFPLLRSFRAKAYNIVVAEERRLNRIGRWLHAAVKPGAGLLEPTFSLVFIFLVAVPVAQDPPIVLNLRVARAREIVNHLRGELSIRSEVDIVLVKYHPLVFSVEPEDGRKQRFRLSVEVPFLLKLDDDELLGALAHEMGHVWIFTHFPSLQTEMLANSIGQRVAPRRSFERVYAKLWAYERTTGVPLDELLGPAQDGVSTNTPAGITPEGDLN